MKFLSNSILNIKEKVYNGERHTYVIELILEMRKRGWLWTEEFMWHKKNSYPGLRIVQEHSEFRLDMR